MCGFRLNNLHNILGLQILQTTMTICIWDSHVLLYHHTSILLTKKLIVAKKYKTTRLIHHRLFSKHSWWHHRVVSILETWGGGGGRGHSMTSTTPTIFYVHNYSEDIFLKMLLECIKQSVRFSTLVRRKSNIYLWRKHL